MPKEKPICRIGVLQLKLGKPFGMTKKRLYRELDKFALECNKARNHMAKVFELWHFQNKTTEQQPLLDAEGNPKKNSKGEVMLDRYIPRELTSSTNPTSFYRQGQALCPGLAAKIISALSQEVQSNLKKKVPYNFQFAETKFASEAIVKDQASRPSWRKTLQIPVPSQDSAFALDGAVGKELSTRVLQRLSDLSKGTALVYFPLYSRESGRRDKSVACRVEMRQMAKGHRAVMKRIALRQWKMKDSTLIKKKKDWYLLVTYEQPTVRLDLDESIEAEMSPLPPTSWHAFTIKTDGAKFWNIGRSRELLRDYAIQVARRKLLQNRYKDSGVGSRGRGKGKFFAKFRPTERRNRYSQDRYAWSVANEAIRYCIRHNCGVMVYRRPSMGLKRYSWYEFNGVPFDWTSFESKIGHKCKQYGIKLVVKKMRLDEQKERYPKVDLPSSKQLKKMLESMGEKDRKLRLGYGDRGSQAAPLATSIVIDEIGEPELLGIVKDEEM